MGRSSPGGTSPVRATTFGFGGRADVAVFRRFRFAQRLSAWFGVVYAEPRGHAGRVGPGGARGGR
eukprot:3530165-Lingulodinium_polyedra.AAC.1